MRRSLPDAALRKSFSKCSANWCRYCAGIAGVAAVIARGEPLPAFDLHCPLLSLPLAFATELATIPADDPLPRDAAVPGLRPGASGCRSAGRSSAWPGREIRATTTISIDRSVLQRWRRCSICRTSHSSACSTTCASGTCRFCKNCRTCTGSDSEVLRFRRYRRGGLADGRRDIGRYRGCPSGRRARQAAACCCCRLPRIFAGCASGRTARGIRRRSSTGSRNSATGQSVIDTLRQDLMSHGAFWRSQRAECRPDVFCRNAMPSVAFVSSTPDDASKLTAKR